MAGLRERCPEMVALLEYTTDSIFFKRYNGERFVIELTSEAKAKNSGVSWGDMIGKTDFDFLPPEEAQKCHDDEMRIIRTGEPIIGKEEKLTRPDGKRSWVSVSKFPWRDESTGEIIGIIGIARDITEKKKLERYILQMVSILSHDTRAPLVEIGLKIKRLMKGKNGEVSESVKNVLDEVFKKIIQVEKISGECLTEASLMISDGIGRMEVLDLRRDIINPLLEEFSEERERKNIQVDDILGAIPSGKILVSANKAWLKIVYRNLFSNAVRYTPEGGKIAFGFEDRGEHYQLNVFNTGEAIPPEKQEAIFRMFESEKSTGIGLAVCRELIERHDGALWYEETPDGFPNFVFTLPKKDEGV